ncbi:MAG: CAF17-like 4Fe-4S cluster assembly/insertion protein YgfZ [Gemmatimonadota bacterium]
MIRRQDRVVIRMYGREPLKMIQGLATNDIAGAPENTSVYTTFLTPKGKLIGDARVVRRPDGDIWIEADTAAADNIASNLKKSVPPLFAKFEFTDYAVVADAPDSVSRLATLTKPFSPDMPAAIVSAETAETAMTATAAMTTDDEVARIEAGEPKWGVELTEDVIPLEAGLRDVAISQSKGCYTGQEVIIRILHRGHVNRHLRGIMTGSTEVPAAGTELLRDGKTIGKVTSAVYSPRFGQAIALAYVRREVEPPAVVQMNGYEARVVELPFK